MQTWIKQILGSKQRVAAPILTHPGIEKIGKKVCDAVTDGQIHYEAIKAVSDAYPSAACTVIMDLTVEAEAFGAKINMPEDEVPSVTGRLVSNAAEVEALNVPDLSAGRVPEYLKANRLAVENIKDKWVFAGCIGPYSLAGRLYDMSEIMVAIYMEPDTIHQLLNKCTQFLIAYCRELKKTGTQGVIMAEPAAGLLSNEDCAEYSTQYVRQIVEAVQDEQFSVILHNCGNTGQCTETMIESGAAALHFGNAIDMTETLEKCPSDLIVMGNIDPVNLFKTATPERVKEATLELLNKAGKYKNFVLSSGCDIPPHTPEVNIQAFYEALEEYNRSL